MESYLLVHRPRSQSKRNRKTLRRARRTTRGGATWFSYARFYNYARLGQSDFASRRFELERSAFEGYGGRFSLQFALRSKRRLERVTRLELATSSLARRCSTTELHPQFTYEKRLRNPTDIIRLSTDFIHRRLST